MNRRASANPDVTQPRTAAGRALHDRLLRANVVDTLTDILAIEAEAAALDVERLAEALVAADLISSGLDHIDRMEAAQDLVDRYAALSRGAERLATPEAEE